MTIPTVTPIATVPIRSAVSASVFRAQVEDFFDDLPPFSNQINATATAMNVTAGEVDINRAAAQNARLAAEAAYAGLIAGDASASIGSSTSSVAVGSGAKAFTASTGRLWYPMMAIILRSAGSPGSFMVGRVTSYDVGTGALVVAVFSTAGAGTFTDWQIYPAGPAIFDQGYNSLGSLSPVAQPSVSFAGIANTWTDLRLRLSLTNSATASLRIELYDGTNWTAVALIGGNMLSGTTFKGIVELPGYAADIGGMLGLVAPVAASPAIGHATVGSATYSLNAWAVSGGIKGVRVTPSAGNITGTAAIDGRI